MKKLNLLIDEPFVVYALSTAEQSYRLVWLLNDALNSKLVHSEEDDIVIIAEGKNRNYPLFRFDDEESHMHICLLANKINGVSLFPKYKSVDFFLKFAGLLNKDRIEEMVAAIKNINEIMACIQLETVEKQMANFFIHL